jgi:hypothetical protein
MKMDLKKTRHDCGLGEVAVSCGLGLIKKFGKFPD